MLQKLSGALLILTASLVNAADFPQPYNSRDDADAVVTTPQKSLQALELPPGFQASLFASEPDVQNPISMTWDARGRLWIAENFTYAEGNPRFDLGLRDRVLILEDTDADGQADSRTVFTDDVQILTSVEVGHGGVWLMCPPQLLFIPDANQDDVPDGPPQVVLDGFTVAENSYHNFANGLRWGPDGWLYGRCGGSCPGQIGRPGTPVDQRIPLRGGLWRYHPASQAVEVLNTGTTNPWGHDWDALGECFFVNTVNGHFWHLIPGLHMKRNGSSDPNPLVYEMVGHHADHWHFDTGQHWSKSRDGAANELGGGHAHSGAMIYLADNWPEEYRGRLYTINLHGRRMNQEIIEREGSGYVAHHGRDLLVSNDPWFRSVDISYGPDGSVYVIDWSDIGECHERNGVHRTSGRVFRIVAEGDALDRKTESVNLKDLSDQKLMELHHSSNEWFVRQSRLILAERQRAGQLDDATAAALLDIFRNSSSDVDRIRALLTLFTIDAIDRDFLIDQLEHPQESVRVWSIRMLTDSWLLDGPLGPVNVDEKAAKRCAAEAEQLLPRFIEVAEKDQSGLVRLVLASTLQRLPVEMRGPLAQALVAHSEDATDHNLPYLVWYGIMPMTEAEPETVLPIAAACQWPVTRKFIARRLAEDLETRPVPLSKLLTYTATQPAAYQIDILDGISEALRGWRRARPPANWSVVQEQLAKSKNPQVLDRVRELNVIFGDGRALDEMKTLALDQTLELRARQDALRALIESRPPELRGLCEQMLKDRNMVALAASGLALYDDPAIADQLISRYRHVPAGDQPKVISILVSRPSFARRLLDALAREAIPRSHLNSYHVRQIHSFGDEGLTQRVSEVWGQLRDSPEEKRKQIAELKSQLTDSVLAKADLSQGRVLFHSMCGKCHKLYGEGGTTGPDITGSNRFNLDYLLENIIDPSAVVNKDFRMTVVALTDGRILNGVITAQTDRTLTLQSLTEILTLEKSDIDELQPTSLSPMPEGQLEKLTPDQIRDLIGYLRHSEQVPLPHEGPVP